jgi:hypothetical protein
MILAQANLALGASQLSSDRIVNPFATRWVRPGVLPYRFSDGGNLEQVIEKLRRNRWRGAIVGSHGTGKSTLLAELIRHFESGGHLIENMVLRDGQRHLPAEFWDRTTRKSQCLIVVDGFEQLGWWPRRRLLRACRRHDWGLLITAHKIEATAGLPVIHRSFGELPIVQHLIDHSLPFHGGEIHPDDVASAFRRHGGNVRETMFSLYELFEQRRRRMHIAARE